MSLHHLHLILLHFPIVGVVASLAVLALGLLRRHEAITRLALAGVVMTALLGWATLLTGEAAEEAVEHLPQVAEATIETHEEAAQLAMLVTALAATAAIAAWIASYRSPRWWHPRLGALTATLLVAAVASMLNAGNTGGQIRHPELGAADAPTQGAQTGASESNGHVDD